MHPGQHGRPAQIVIYLVTFKGPLKATKIYRFIDFFFHKNFIKNYVYMYHMQDLVKKIKWAEVFVIVI